MQCGGFGVLKSIQIIMMVSAEHSSNKGKNKDTKKYSKHGNSLNTLKKNLSKLQLSS